MTTALWIIAIALALPLVIELLFGVYALGAGLVRNEGATR